MLVSFHKTGWEDYLYWQEMDRKTLRKINTLIKEIQRNPFTGTGKPEALKHHLAGTWSRRIDSEHRLVYQISDKGLVVIQCRYHY